MRTLNARSAVSTTWLRLSRRILKSPHGLAPCAVVLVALIGLLDYATGPNASIALLYLVPIAAVTWVVDLRAGLLVSGLSVAVRLPELWASASHRAHPLLSSWNVLVELGFFIVFAIVLARLRQTTDRETLLARTDPLTGALNRRAFGEVAAREIARSERYGGSLSLAYLDIDDFNKINDTGGHEAGDRVLIEVARTLESNLRATDVVARFGGDEFVLLLPETGAQAADAVLGKLMVALRAGVQSAVRADVGASARKSASARAGAIEFGIDLGPRPKLPGFSIGAVSIDGPSASLDRLLLEADELVYAAKRDGKDCVRHRHLASRQESGPSITSSAWTAADVERFSSGSRAAGES